MHQSLSAAWLAGLIAGSLAISAVAAPPPPSGEMLANTCGGCHGTHGRLADSAFMPLAGMPQEQFVKAMLDFKAERRPATLMSYIAQGFSDQELEAMGEFFSKVKP